MEKENQFCPLDSHTPETLVKEYSAMEDSTKDLLSLFRSTPHSGLRKLQTVFLALQNYDIIPLIEETHTSNRAVRYTATFIILSKMKKILKTKEESSLIDEIYDSVFKVRIRDVDPHIRSMALQFLAEWACASALFRVESRLKDLEDALHDRSDLVKGKALRCIRKVISHRLGKTLSSFFASNTLIEIVHHDANTFLRREASLLLYTLYSGSGAIPEPELIKIMLIDKTESRERTKALHTLLPDRLHLLERIHEILLGSPANAVIFRYLDATALDVSNFMHNLKNFIKESSTCCREPSLCYLDVLCELSSKAVPGDFLELLEMTKDNKFNTCKIIRALQNVISFSEHAEISTKILYKLRDMVRDEPFCADEYVKLLSILRDSLSHAVDDIVNSLAPDLTLPIIRAFDITDSLTRPLSSLESCYAALWFISKGSFSRIEDLTLTDSDNYLKLVLFLELFWNYTMQMTGATSILEEAAEAAPVDVGTALLLMSKRLYKLISDNFNFTDEESCLYLFKLLDVGLFADKAYLLYENCSNETLNELIIRSKAPRAMVTGYFVALQEHRRLSDLGKVLARSLPKNEQSIFASLKPCLHKKYLLDKVLVHFVPHLTVEECIFVESSVPKGRLKSACMRKIRGSTQKTSLLNDSLHKENEPI